jgi:hypothetical protein
VHVSHQRCLPFIFWTNALYSYLISRRLLLYRSVNINFIWKYAFLPVCVPSSVPPFLPSFCGLAVAQEVSRRLLTTAEDRVRSQTIPYEICSEYSGTRLGLFPNILRFPPSLSFHSCSVLRITHLSSLLYTSICRSQRRYVKRFSYS